jgi:hypothetical protein
MTLRSMPVDPTETRDFYEVLTERHRAGSIIVTSNRLCGAPHNAEHF